MVMPFLLLGGFLLLHKIGEWFGGGWCDVVFGIGLLLVLVLNISKFVPFVFEQHACRFTTRACVSTSTIAAGSFCR